MLLLLSGISIGLMMMVNTEGKVGNADLKNNAAYHNAEGGIEQMTSDLAGMFQSMQAPRPSDICALSTRQPYITGVTWKDYQVQPATGCTAPLPKQYGQIASGPNKDLWAQIIPVTMLATAAQAGGQEVSMMRTAQVALIPVFQFGVFCDGDCSFFSGPNFDFAGRVHTNGDLYPEVGPGSNLWFHDKITAYGNVVRTQLANGFPTAANYNGNVMIPTAAQGCDLPARPACRALGLTEGSVTGAGGDPPQSASNTNWPTISLSLYNSRIADGNYGNTYGTGVKKLSLPFVNAGNLPYEIIRRPRVGEVAGSALGASREYNMAQIRVLLSDDPGELPGGAADANNIRLSNSVNPGPDYSRGVPVPIAGQPATTTTYFAEGTTAGTARNTTGVAACLTNAQQAAIALDWPNQPAAAPAGAQTLVPAGAPLLPPAGTWNMLDGYLRVEYKDVNGNWIPVTREWLELGFARGTTPPTAPGTNPVHPNAILILQQPADRNGNGFVNGLPGALPADQAGAGCVNPTPAPRPAELQSDAATGSVFYGDSGQATSATRTNWYPINFYDTREGETRDVAAGNNSSSAVGVMNAVEIDVGNLKRWLWGQIGVSGGNVDYQTQNGWVLYFSDRRGMLPNPNPPFNGAEKSGDSGLEDSINTASAAGVPDGVLESKGSAKFSPEDVNQNTLPDFFGTRNIGLGFYNGAANVNAGIIAANNAYLPRIVSSLNTARKNWVSGPRHAVKLVDGAFGNVPYRDFATQGGTPESPGGFTVASENPVYIQGDYNSNAADPTWAGGVDLLGHAAAAVIADAVVPLSNAWSDLNSFANPTTVGPRNANTTYYRLAIAGGKNMNFPKPGWGKNDYGTDGGTHNFLRYLESWNGDTLNYKGSLVSLYYSTYNTGVYKCCDVVYQPPTRNYSFDADFALPGGLPPGTPLFRDVDTLGYRQIFATRSY
jgi:hypothetical protein